MMNLCIAHGVSIDNKPHAAKILSNIVNSDPSTAVRVPTCVELVGSIQVSSGLCYVYRCARLYAKTTDIMAKG